MKIAITGADGQLGSDIATALKDLDPVVLTEDNFEITDRDIVLETLLRSRPDVVINTAAFTDVDKCEGEDIVAFKVNALGVKYVAQACEEIGASLVHISTDYVFDGRKKHPYAEDDPAFPLNVYGMTKLAGEIYARNTCRNCYIVRTSGLYGTHRCIGKGSNFVDTMLKLSGERPRIKVVSDEVLTPTFTEDLAKQIRKIIDASPPFGIYHATNEGECSWFDFAGEIFRIAGKEVILEKTTSAQWGAQARRPSYSVLENKALKTNGINIMPHWKDALRRYLEKKAL